MSRRRSRRLLLPPAVLLGTLALAPAAGAITGVCPDGSIFIVQSADAIPCRDAKRVDSSDVPPLQPEYLPRPYGWEVFNQRSDPNNPYNVVRPRDGRAPDVAAPPPQGHGAPPPPVAPEPARTPALRPDPRVASAPPPAPSPSPPGLDLGLSDREVADLGEIVDLMQSVAPATVMDVGDSGERRLAVQIARSTAFEQRVHAALLRRGATERGPVVLFRAEARAPVAFHGNLTFVQGHVAFHPDPDNPGQFGVLAGDPGALASGDRVLGYAVLPPHVDPAEPLDIYWNDRRITATLRP